MTIRQGEIYWVAPEDDRGSTIAHPHVVVQDDALNDSRIETTILCALSSVLRKAEEPGNILLEKGEANLPSRSVVVVSHVTTVSKSRLDKCIGKLDAVRISQVLDGMRFVNRLTNRSA